MYTGTPVFLKYTEFKHDNDTEKIHHEKMKDDPCLFHPHICCTQWLLTLGFILVLLSLYPQILIFLKTYHMSLTS